MDVYRAGRVALANAPGTGVADDKVVYAYVPADREVLPGRRDPLPNVPTFLCAAETDRKHVLAHLPELVVKAANESGGYGMLVGPRSTKDEQAEFGRADRSEPPQLHRAADAVAVARARRSWKATFKGRHVDLRPYILYGKDIFVLPGGLTRVALKEGSLVVNSSQGGGSKDTWVLADDARNGEGTVDGNRSPSSRPVPAERSR